MSDNAVNGGVAGGNPDPVSDATKWLYYEVRTGGYAPIYTAATSLGVSNDLGANFQYAFWYLENERTATEIGGVTSPGYLLAQYALANQNWSSLFAAGNRVYAINLTDATGAFRQDQLAYQYAPVREFQSAPVPEPGTLLLLGAALLAGSRKLRSRARRAIKD